MSTGDLLLPRCNCMQRGLSMSNPSVRPSDCQMREL